MCNRLVEGTSQGHFEFQALLNRANGAIKMLTNHVLVLKTYELFYEHNTIRKKITSTYTSCIHRVLAKPKLSAAKFSFLAAQI